MIIKQAIIEGGWGPGGWIYHQQETGWDAPHPLANNFAAQVKNIIKHREANARLNLSTDPQVVGRELEEFTIARWRKTYSEHGIQKFLENPAAEKKKQNNDSFLKLSSAVGVVGRVADLDTDALEDWLGAGGVAVSVAQATQRAMVCADCKNGNQLAGWRDFLTVSGADALRKYLAWKNQKALSTPLDGQLGVCKACKCYLPLKVWTPLEHIAGTMKKEHWDALLKLNPVCWIRNET